MTLRAPLNFPLGTRRDQDSERQIRAQLNEEFDRDVYDFVTIADGDATPDVSAARNLVTNNSAPTTITDMDNGIDGQRVTIRFGDTDTTVDFTTSSLKGNGGVDWSPSLYDKMECVLLGTIWSCSVVGVAPGGAGTGDLVSTNNLGDVANSVTSRQNLGVEIGVDVQAWSAILDATTASFTTADETKLDSIVLPTVARNITASTTQTQGQQPLTATANLVETVANLNDVVTLPLASAALGCEIVNAGANTLQIFPASGDAIQGGAVDASSTLAAGDSVRFRAFDATDWYIG